MHAHNANVTSNIATAVPFILGAPEMLPNGHVPFGIRVVVPLPALLFGGARTTSVVESEKVRLSVDVSEAF